MVLTGALGALDETPDFVAYGMAKSAVHQLVLSYEENGIGEHGVDLCAILPGVIDTPQNRAAMPDANTADWTPPMHIASELVFLTPCATGEQRPFTSDGL